MSEEVIPPAGPTYPRCETCRHWQPATVGVPKYDAVKATTVITVVGECRALPPVADLKWPKSRPVDFCGKWEKAGAEAVVEDSAKAARKVAKKAGEKVEVAAGVQRMNNELLLDEARKAVVS